MTRTPFLPTRNDPIRPGNVWRYKSADISIKIVSFDERTCTVTYHILDDDGCISGEPKTMAPGELRKYYNLSVYESLTRA